VYRHVLNLLHEFFGGKAEIVLAAGLAALAAAVLLLLSKSWRRGVAEAQEHGGWRAVVMGLAQGLITLLSRACSARNTARSLSRTPRPCGPTGASRTSSANSPSTTT